MLGDLNFTTTWQTYSADITVTHNMGYGRDNDKGNSFQTIAFNLWKERSTDPNTIYYFDNIKLTVPTSGSAVSSRRSIIPPDKPLSTLPTIAAYHQDGLWQLEEASADGKFYIKKYDSNEYLNCDLADPYAAAFAVLGPKDETHGQYSLVNPVASRYTLVQNVQYQTAALSPDMFYHWNGYGADASIDNQHGNVDFFFQLGQQLNSGDVVAGTGGVDYVRYANLTGYTTMIVKGTPGMVVRVLMNRQESNSGPYTLRELTIGNDGKVELDLTDIKNDAGYVHLNAIKIGWGQSGAITDVELVNKNQVNTSSPLYLNHSNGDGYPVMERNDDADNHWYAAFYPVEVPVPNKDGFYQVLVKWGTNMIDHNGGSSALPADVSDYDLWQLEMVDDYKHFRLKDPNGRYLKPGGTGVTEPNNPEGAETNTNEKFWTDFALTWYYINPVPKEIPVDYMITHRMSYLKDYTTQYQGLELDRQGLTTVADSYWWNNDSKTQKVNHFEITHYVKQGQTITVPLPTILNASNDHVYYQRWYHYNDETCDNETYPDGTDLEGLKSHVSVDSRDDGDVQYFLYKNGMVTGQKLDWTGIEQSSYKRNVQRNFYFTNSDGKAFTVAADVSRYSDFTYENESNHLQGDLEEPSLTMRYIYYMRDAKTMAAQLTACAPGTDKWLETKTFHFPARQIFYESQKKAGYRGEFIGLRHLFSDYWVFENSSYADAYNEGIAYNLEHPEDQRDLTYLDEYLRSAVTGKSSGRIEVEIVDDATHPTGIRKGGWNPNIDRYGFTDGNDADYEGFYFYDMMDFNNVTDAKASYGDSRFIVFRYPASGMVNVPADPSIKQEAKINVYLNYNGTKYQLAQFTIIFDPGTVTLPYKQINGTSPYVLNDDFKDRDPKALVDKAGAPIAKVTFDYPTGDKYHFPAKGTTKQGWWEAPANATIDNSSPIPLIFDKTNYAFMGFECNWGSYSIVTQMTTNYGNHQNAMPANDNTYGYGHADYPALQADPYLQNGFLYIDASEQPGDICSAPFVGDFCAGDKLMFSGWISGSNKAGGGDNRCPGGITLTVKGEHKVNGKMQTETLYRFCPGQIYELDNNTGTPDGSGVDGEQWLKNAQGQYIDNNGNVVDEEHRVPNPNYDNNKYYVVWQQFYFEFVVTDKYDRHWIEVNNNCVSSKGGDFMLDNIEVYAIVPEVKVEMNSTYCVEKDGTVDMSLLKIMVDYNKEKSSMAVNDENPTNHYIGFVFLKKDIFLNTFKENLSALSEAQLRPIVDVQALATLFGLEEFSWDAISLDDLAYAIEEGLFEKIIGDQPHQSYIDAFNAAFLGDQKIWKANSPTTNMGGGVMYFQWNSDFNSMEEYSFAKAVNKTNSAYRYTDEEGEKWIVMNGNYPELPWEANVDYYIIPSNEFITDFSHVYGAFNICSPCSKADDFRLDPPYELIGLEYSEDSNDYMVCEGQIPTLLTDLKGYDFNGVEVPMNDINYDWWLGDPTYTERVTDDDNNITTIRPKLPTLENYHAQVKNGVKLDVALSTLRIYYPDVTSLDGIIPQAANTETNKPEFTQSMIDYLKELVDAGELVLHQKSISVPAKPASKDDPYFYMVACPIHDEQYDQALNPKSINIVNNGSMEGSDASSFFTRHNNINSVATITNGVGKNASRGIRITSQVNTIGNDIGRDWNTQFFIQANEVIPVGTTFHLEFDYKASSEASIHTQYHAEPSNCIYYNGAGNLSFKTEWQHFSRDIEITSAMAPNNNFQSIAFDLWKGTLIDYYFDNVELTVPKNQYVAFFCDEPQGLRVKVGNKAPTLKTGFVPGENGFDSYNYAGAGDAILSIRLAKREQFETVKHGEPNASTIDTPETTSAETTHFLWLPIRDALVQSSESSKVIQKSEDENIYLASTNDPTWDKTIYQSMKKGSLPIVGKIVQLNAIDMSKAGENDSENNLNRLCVYFTNNFDVREGYSYTLSLPFQESPGENTCDGTILINLKIVPDYEVWTGAAGNTDWNNDENWRRADGNLGTSTEESINGAGKNNNELYRTNNLPDNSPLKEYVTNYSNYRTAKDRLLRKGFAPLYCTHVLIKNNEWGDAPQLYDALAGKEMLEASPFPNLRDKDGWDGTSEAAEPTKATSTPILRYDMQARHYELWEETYGISSNKGREGDLIAEMYQVNSCDEIAFQPGAEMLNAHLLNYNNAWVEYQLNNRRWYLLGSPLQGTISGEWYAPTGTAQQKTTYYENVTFGEGYDRYSPAIYQRSWDKAKAVLYEVGSTYSTDDNPDDLALVDGQLPGSAQQGAWEWDSNNWNWNATGSDTYLDRLGYKPLGDKKVNVAMKGIWSNTYNDATVDYTKGGFSVMVMNHLKGSDGSDGTSIIRLPKEDTMYDYYKFEQTGAADGGTDTYLSDTQENNYDDVQTNLHRALNRGRLKTDQLLPIIGDGLQTYQKIQRTETTASRYGDMRTYTRVPTRVGTNALPMTLQSFTETVSAGISNMGYYLVENPFPCGLDMEKFFAANTGLEKKYWLLTASGQHLVQKAADANEWISPTEEVVTGEEPNTVTTFHFTAANTKVAPGQGFFVQAKTAGESTVITFTADMQAQTRYGEPDAGEEFEINVGTEQVMESVQAVDEEGNGLVDENHQPVMVDVPKVDDQGNYVLKDITETVTIYKYKQKTGAGYEFPLQSRRTRGSEGSMIPGLVITAQRGSDKSSALVMKRESASNDFLPSEDTETFISIDDLKQVPMVYTLCGRLATTINSIHDFTCLPLGVESNSDAPCTLTFNGVELLGDSVAFYDAMERKLTPLESGMKFTVSGQTQNRYYLVKTLIQEEAAEETHLQIFTEGRTAKVIASTAEPVTDVRCFDTAGRLVHQASPQTMEYSFTLPDDGIYIIEAKTEKDRKTKKVAVK